MRDYDYKEIEINEITNGYIVNYKNKNKIKSYLKKEEMIKELINYLYDREN